LKNTKFNGNEHNIHSSLTLIRKKNFHDELQKRDPFYKEMTYAWGTVEDEAFALCRFLRARDFKIEDVFEMMDEGKDRWNEAKANDFYPDPDKALDNPASALLTQYPVVKIGMAKNKCPVSYLKAGQIYAEGVECVTTLENMTKYFWYDNIHAFPKFMANLQAADPDIERMQTVSIFDLEGLTTSQLSSKTMDVVKAASAVAVCFPESLNSLIILNAPGFFSFSWRVIKGFINPRTVSKIEVHSSRKSGMKRLEEIIGEDQLPSDYGGKLMSTSEVIQQMGKRDEGGNSVRRQIVELMAVKSKKQKQFELEADETVTLNVYTKSSSGANFTIKKEEETVVDGVSVKGKGTTEEPLPCGTQIAASIKGPGKFNVEANAESGKGVDHFLLIGDVFA